MNHILGDVHGQIELLTELVDEIKRTDPKPSFWFCGDYVDRGGNSFQTVQYLLQLRREFPCKFVRGNHDDVWDLCINGKSKGGTGTKHDDIRTALQFVRQGLMETLNSYGISEIDVGEVVFTYDRAPDEAYEKFLGWREGIPETHKEFFANLPFIEEHKDFFICHAHFPYNMKDAREEFDNPLNAGNFIWDRFDNYSLRAEKEWSRVGFFGHTPTSYYNALEEDIVIKGEKMYLLDTGACFGGKLTAFCWEDKSYIQAGEDGITKHLTYI